MTVGPPLIAGLLLVTLVVAVIGVGVLGDAAQQRRQVALRAYGQDLDSPLQRLRRRLDARVRATSRGARLARRLSGAGLTLRPVDALALVTGAGLLVALVLSPFLGKIGSVIAFVAVCYVADRWLQRRVQMRVEAFVGQLPEVARVLSDAAAAGLALRTAISMAADELDAPAGEELGAVANGLAVGQSLDQSLAAMQERLPSRELSVLVQTLVIQSRAGGALVSALQNISLTLEQRKELRREVRTVVSGAVFGGYIVTGLGIGSVFVMNLLSPGALDALSGTTVGRIVLVVAAGFFAAGYVLINRLTRIDI